MLTRWEMRRGEEEMEGEERRRRFDSQYEDFTGGDPRQEVKSAADFFSFSLVAADAPLRYPDGKYSTRWLPTHDHHRLSLTRRPRACGGVAASLSDNRWATAGRPGGVGWVSPAAG